MFVCVVICLFEQLVRLEHILQYIDVFIAEFALSLIIFKNNSHDTVTAYS